MSLIAEFKEFAIKGNVVDLAVGVVVGSAFTAITNSLVKDLIMPAFGYLLGQMDLTQLKWVLREAEVGPAGLLINEAVVVSYGNFLQLVLNFLIIAVTIFCFIKGLNQLRRDAEDPSKPNVPMPKDIQILTEIRDLLKNQPHT